MYTIHHNRKQKLCLRPLDRKPRLIDAAEPEPPLSSRHYSLVILPSWPPIESLEKERWSLELDIAAELVGFSLCK